MRQGKERVEGYINEPACLLAALRVLLAHDHLKSESAEQLAQWQHTEQGYIPPFIWRRALAKVDKYQPIAALYARPSQPLRGNGRRALESEGFPLMLLRRKLETLPIGEDVPFGQFLVRRIMTDGGVRWRCREATTDKAGRELSILDVLLKLQEVQA